MKHSCISQQKGGNYQWYNNNNNNNNNNTDREVSANNPDIVIKDHAYQCCKLTDVHCISTIQPKHLDKSHWKAFKIQRYWDWNHENVGNEGRDCAGYCGCTGTS